MASLVLGSWPTVVSGGGGRGGSPCCCGRCWHGGTSGPAAAMLTCPHCLHTFEQPPDSSSSNAAVDTPRCCAAAASFLLAPPSPCVRVFADSGGGLVLTPGTAISEKQPSLNPFLPQPTTLQLSFAQPSPSVQLSFVLPTHPATSWCSPVTPPALRIVSPNVFLGTADTDLVRLKSTQKALRTSGWYYEGLSWQESAATLDRCSPGTFLVRDSSDPRFLFSLSVQTTRGPTSVRLHYLNGQFRLDAEEHLARYIPTFECVLRLVEHYVALGGNSSKSQQQQLGEGSSNSADEDRERHVWVDLRGHMYSPILLTRPKRRAVPTLQHLARIAINQRLPQNPQQRNIVSLNLPASIETYLRDYPYTQ
ncbi:hypothetical protein B566_EDAN012774 [Ephemera danica]|nr:hypothetical protein B566_EDAN012774 [Ephemera danica]